MIGLILAEFINNYPERAQLKITVIRKASGLLVWYQEGLC
jgi:hypothetical protein